MATNGAKVVMSVRVSQEDVDLLKRMADANLRPVSLEFSRILRKVAQEEGFQTAK